MSNPEVPFLADKIQGTLVERVPGSVIVESVLVGNRMVFTHPVPLGLLLSRSFIFPLCHINVAFTMDLKNESDYEASIEALCLVGHWVSE